VRIYTAHTHTHRAPVLVREGFSYGAFVFGPLWLLARRAWIAGVLVLCADVVIFVLAPPDVRLIVSLGVSWLTGLFGHDMLRWSLDRRGFLEAHVVAAADEDAALARLLERRPDLISDALA
jgi:Protein of unknown function (DUF2628)